MSAHTPGAWVVGEDGIFERTGALDYVPVLKHNSGVIAFAYTNCLVKSDEQCIANARLIAAAPELLEMLIEARKEFAGLPHSLGYDFTHLPKLDALIAKATGEQS